MNLTSKSIALGVLTAASVAVATGTAGADTGIVPAANTVATSPAPAAPVAGADPMSDFNQSVEAANGPMGAAMAVGTAIGSVGGMVIGCPLGIATGGTLVAVASLGTLTVPAVIGGCALGAIAVGGFGAIAVGTAMAIPVGIAAGTQKWNQLQAQHAAAARPAP